MVEIANLKVKPDQKLVTDGMYTKKHVVQALKITSVDPFTDKVKGTADPGTVVTVTAMIDWGENLLPLSRLPRRRMALGWLNLPLSDGIFREILSVFPKFVIMTEIAQR